jgi:hypothetical protein
MEVVMDTIYLLAIVGIGVSGFTLLVGYVVIGEFLIFLRNRARVIQDESVHQTPGGIIFFHNRELSAWQTASKDISPDDYTIVNWAYTLLPLMLVGLGKLAVHSTCQFYKNKNHTPSL